MKPKCCVCGIEDPIPTDGKISSIVYWYRYLGDGDDFKTRGVPVEEREDLFQEIADKVYECEEESLFLCPDCLDDLTCYPEVYDEDDFLEEDILNDNFLDD